jgi:serine/threonine protein kinase
VSASRPAVPEPEEIAGRYKIVQKLGAGAFGTVYKARDTRLADRMVAIKTIRLEGLAASTSSLEDLFKRFKKEADVAANLKHPNIVTIYDWGESEGMSYISMEYVDGVGLDRVIAKSGKMSVERTASIGAQVADALAFAQKHNVVHRDIKPANIMIEAGDHVKVTDFGIAKVTESADHLTQTGSLLGTPSYMSPEQARGQKVDGRSDLFSLGCILYEMVGGQKAFRGDSITALIFKIITEEPPSLRELDPTVPDEMLRIIAKALSKAPETRYQTGRELADDLLAITRPGFVPTLHAADVPTLPPDASPRDVPTIASPPTVRPSPTISAAATAARPAAASPGPPPRGAPPPLPPTILTRPAARAAAAPAPPKPVARPPRPAPSPTAARKGGGAGLLLALGLVAVLGLAAVVGGAWYLFGRKAGTTEPSPAEQARAMVTPAPAEAASPEPGAVAHAELMPSPGPATTTTSGTIAEPTPPEPSAAGMPSAGDYAFLDEPPSEAPDGRAAGEALAQKYRAGGSSSFSSTRFSPRPRWPRGLNRAEGPAVRALLHIHSAEEAYHRKTGRYGNLREMADAAVFGLDVPFRADGFRRARYAFHVTTEGDGYRVEATPLAPIGRAFVVDDSGFVQLRDE